MAEETLSTGSITVPALTTARLSLAPLRLEDAAAIQACFPRWEIVRFLLAHVPWPYPSDGARTFVEAIALPAMREGRAWHWTIRRRDAPEILLGLISLIDDPQDNRGFWLVPEAQGQGLMTEACAIVTDFWFDGLRRRVLRVSKASLNARSSALSRRMGMRLVGETKADYVSGCHVTEVWEITAAEWRMHRGRRADP